MALRVTLQPDTRKIRATYHLEDGSTREFLLDQRANDILMDRLSARGFTVTEATPDQVVFERAKA